MGTEKEGGLAWKIRTSGVRSVVSRERGFFCFVSFFHFFWMPRGIWNSWARDQIRATGAAEAAAAATLDPEPTVPGRVWNLHLSAPKTPPIPLYHSGNSSFLVLFLKLSRKGGRKEKDEKKEMRERGK